VDVEGQLTTVENGMRYDQSGADRVVFGTAAIGSPGVVQEACRLLGPRVVLSVVVLGDKVTVHGGGSIARVDPLSVAEQASAWGVTRLIYGEARGEAGTLERVAEKSLALGFRMSLKGGRTLDALQAFLALEQKSVDELLVGPPLYSGLFTLDDARRVVSRA
jgi:phosphoribosylformimino-5-aminoimidazole carboxamide ribotide isomerase